MSAIRIIQKVYFFSFFNIFIYSRDVAVPVPPCPAELGEGSDGDTSDRPGVTRSHSERLMAVCRDFSTSCQEVQEKYHEMIYCTAEKVLRNSQANQLKQLKTMLEKETNDVMRQLNLARRNEVKDLALKHKDRDELVRLVFATEVTNRL